MQLPVLAICIFFFVSIGGQNLNCDFDPDLIYFEDEELDRLKSTFKGGGGCSPIVWKNFDKVVEHQIRNRRNTKYISYRDQELLKKLTGHEHYQIINDYKLSANHDQSQKTISINSPESKNLSPINFFSPRTKRIPDNLINPNENKSQIPQQPKLFRPNNKNNPQIQGPPTDFNTGYNRKRRQTQDGSLIERPLNQERIEDLFGNDDQDRFFQPTRSRNSQSQRRPPSNEYLFGPESQRRPQFQVRPESFFNQRRPQNQENSFTFNSQRRPQSQRRPDVFSPLNEDELLPSGFQENPRDQDNFFPSRNQEGFFRPSFPSRPETQRRPGGVVGLSNQSRPPNQGPQNISPNNSRRPFRPDIVRPGGQRRPQIDVDDFFVPDNQVETEEFGNEYRPQTTTRRPETTTVPGPPTWATPPSSCVRNCPNTPEYNPVCGSDRTTYRNPGRLRCEQRCGKASVSINHYGNCITTTAIPATTTTTLATTSATATRITTTPPTFSRNLG